MIGKVSRGNGAARLLRYLFGPGRANEHTNPHVVARWDDIAGLFPAPSPDRRSEVRRLAKLLEQPVVALTRKPAKTVWHCSLRTAPADRTLTDTDWAKIATEVLQRTGLAPRSDNKACRWVAVRHAEDHIHLVVTLARQDRRSPRTSNDFYRVGEACGWAEQQFGLTVTAGRDRTAAKRPTRGETEKSRRQGRREAPRATLQRQVRSVAAASTDQSAFLAGLTAAGLLVRERRSDLNPSEITGYAVALPGNRSSTGGPIWFGGGKLAADLSLPKLLARWGGGQLSLPLASVRLTGPARERAWGTATRSAALGANEIRRFALNDPAAAADTAHATSDALSVVAHVVEGRHGGPLTDASDAFDRAAREVWGRPPAPTRTGERLRQSVRTLHLLGRASRDETAKALALVAQLAVLAEEVARLRDAQGRAAQAAAARVAADRLRRVAPPSLPAPRTRTQRRRPVPRLEGAAR